MSQVLPQIRSDSPLLKEKAYINGMWIGAETGKCFAVTNPANGSVLAHVPDMGRSETVQAIAAAQGAFPVWAALTGKERSAILHGWFRLIRDHADALAELLSAEQGKPVEEARSEVLGGAASVEWFAEEAKRVYGDFIPAHKANARIIVEKQPVGVVGAITPWNFPSAMITRKVAPAVAAGCTVVLKPAEDTPLSALALAVLAEQAGVPAGVFNVVTASYERAAEVGEALTGDDRVRKISFTGSTEVGRLLMKQSAPQIKKISLELGGNAPFIVFADADMDQAVAGAVASKTRNCGQTCISANRIYVEESIFDEFVSRFRDAYVKAPRQPLINREGLEKVQVLLQDALDKGAVLYEGGDAEDRDGTYFAPTILTGVDQTMRMFREEIFGPVAAFYTFCDEAALIAQANDTEYGLAAYIYTTDLSRAFRVSEALEYGMVGVNEPFVATELAPFGGVKHSGLGREGSKYGLDEFTVMKYILLGGI